MFCRKPSEIQTNPDMYIHTKQEQDGKNEGEIQTPESVHRGRYHPQKRKQRVVGLLESLKLRQQVHGTGTSAVLKRSERKKDSIKKN